MSATVPKKKQTGGYGSVSVTTIGDNGRRPRHHRLRAFITFAPACPPPRHRAEVCLLLAQQTIDPDDRRTLSTLAEQWMRLAKEFENQLTVLDTLQEIETESTTGGDGHSQT